MSPRERPCRLPRRRVWLVWPITLAMCGGLAAACGPATPAAAPTPTDDVAAMKRRAASQVLNAFEGAVAGEQPPASIGTALRRKIAGEIGLPAGSHIAAWEPQRPVQWRETPPPDYLDPEVTTVMRATFREGRGRTEDPTVPGGAGVYPFDMRGVTFDVLLEERDGAWVPTDLAVNEPVDGR